MLLGHQGASARTDCMYFAIASCVAASSHDSGSRTTRVGMTMSSIDASESSPERSTSSSRASGSTRLS